MIGVENIIPDALQRLQITGNDAMKFMEKSKDGNGDKLNWGRVTDWVALGVNILTEHLDPHEKIKVLTAAISEAKNVGQAPQEVANYKSFRERMEGPFWCLITDAEIIKSSDEAKIVKL